jgi:hypothetical protein
MNGSGSNFAEWMGVRSVLESFIEKADSTSLLPSALFETFAS